MTQDEDQKRLDEMIQRILMLMDKKSISQNELARMIGVAQPSIFGLLHGKVRKPRYLPDIARVLGVTVEWLLHGHGSNEPSLRMSTLGAAQIPLIGNVQAGSYIEAFEDTPTDFFPAFADVINKRNVFCLKVLGDSMDVLYPESTILYCQKLSDYAADLRDGKRVVVKRRGAGDLFEATVKEYSYSNNTTILSPRSTNPKWKPIFIKNGGTSQHDAGADDIFIYAVVVGSYTPE